jgi:hypothetical protein
VSLSDHDTDIARAARAEIARRVARLPATPADRPPLNLRPAHEVAIELRVWRFCHLWLAPLRWLSGSLSRSRRERS